MLDPRDIQALRYWDVEDQIPDSHYSALQSHPAYPTMCRELSSRMIATAMEDKTFDGIAKDIGRWVAGVLAAYLHITGGLTLPRLKTLCAETGLISPGRARAILIYLQFLGYVRPSAAVRGEARRYFATASLIKTFKLEAQSGLRAVGPAAPIAAVIHAELDNPDVMAIYIRIQGEGFLAAAKEYNVEEPILRLLFHRHAGAQLLHLIHLAIPQETVFPPRGPGQISAAAAARQLRVSRAHLMRVLADAEAKGWLEREPDGALRLGEPIRVWMTHHFSVRLMSFLICGAKAVLEASGLRPGPEAAMIAPAFNAGEERPAH